MNKIPMRVRLDFLEDVVELKHQVAALNKGIAHGCASGWVDSLESGGNGGVLGRLESTGSEVGAAEEGLKLLL